MSEKTKAEEEADLPPLHTASGQLKAELELGLLINSSNDDAKDKKREKEEKGDGETSRNTVAVPPQEVFDWYEFGNGRTNTSINKTVIKDKAKRHLLDSGWNFSHIKKKGKKDELRYNSPTGRTFQSLRTACKFCIDGSAVTSEEGQGQRVSADSKERQQLLEGVSDGKMKGSGSSENILNASLESIGRSKVKEFLEGKMKGAVEKTKGSVSNEKVMNVGLRSIRRSKLKELDDEWEQLEKDATSLYNRGLGFITKQRDLLHDTM